MKLKKIFKSITGQTLSLLPVRWVEMLSDELLKLRIICQEIQRQKITEKLDPVQTVVHSISKAPLKRSVLNTKNDWSEIATQSSHIPSMLTETEKKYYQYIAMFYSGTGEIVELGPWLGSSTFHLISGLENNPYFKTQNKRIHVYDDFVWRSEWMDPFLPNQNVTALTLSLIHI